MWSYSKRILRDGINLSLNIPRCFIVMYTSGHYQAVEMELTYSTSIEFYDQAEFIAAICSTLWTRGIVAHN